MKAKKTKSKSADSQAQTSNDLLASISTLKKDLLMMRIRLTSGEKINLKEYRSKKKEIAVLFTKMNVKKALA